MDIKCVVCGEPWDAYGVSHGDMAKWEASLFRAGAGCPACAGKTPKTGAWEPTSCADIENGDEDPMIRLTLSEDVANRPAWVRPTPVKLWACDCCGLEMQRDPGADLPEDEILATYQRSVDSPAYRYASAYNRGKFCDPETPAHVFTVEGRGTLSVCEGCIEYCLECDEALCGSLSHDVYDGLASFSESGYYHRDQLCIDCYSAQSSDESDESDESDIPTEDAENDNV